MHPTHPDEVQRWIKELARLETGNEFSIPTFVRPYHLVSLAHAIRRRGFDGLALPAKIHGYANRMGLWEAAGLQSPAAVNAKPPAGRFHPVEPLLDLASVETSIQRLSEIAASVGGAQNDPTNIPSTLLSELLENCYAHSGATGKLFGLACGQLWIAGRKAQIAIADDGIGIRRSLSANDDLLDKLESSNACELATILGVTGKPGRGHSGYGLALARQLVEKQQSSLYLVSEDEIFWVLSGKASHARTAARFPGTMVVIEWHTDRPLDAKAVYDTWPQPEEVCDVDYDF